jgi:hypothetical protein
VITNAPSGNAVFIAVDQNFDTSTEKKFYMFTDASTTTFEKEFDTIGWVSDLAVYED